MAVWEEYRMVHESVYTLGTLVVTWAMYESSMFEWNNLACRLIKTKHVYIVLVPVILLDTTPPAGCRHHCGRVFVCERGEEGVCGGGWLWEGGRTDCVFYGWWRGEGRRRWKVLVVLWPHFPPSLLPIYLLTSPSLPSPTPHIVHTEASCSRPSLLLPPLGFSPSLLCPLLPCTTVYLL